MLIIHYVRNVEEKYKKKNIKKNDIFLYLRLLHIKYFII